MRVLLLIIQGQDFAFAPFHTSVPHKHIHKGMTCLSVFEVGMEMQQYHGLPSKLKKGILNPRKKYRFYTPHFFTSTGF